MYLSLLASFGAVEITFTVLGAIALIAIILLLILVPIKAYCTALFSKAHISMVKLVSFKNCKRDPIKLVEAYILSKKLGVDIKIDQIEAVMLSGGNALEMIKAMSLAKESGISLPFSLASALEIKTKDSLEIVKNAVDGKNEIINKISVITKDNIELILDLNLTLKLNIPKYLFGLSVEKIKSFVIEEVIKKSRNFTKDEIMSSPRNICQINCEDAGKNSAYILKEVHVANISIGRNIALEMEVKKAEKERVFAQMQADRLINAEQMRELRTRTKTEETKASLLEAEAQVPIAISQAIKEGRFSVMDYYKLMNLQADTALRRSIVSGDKQEDNETEEDDDDDFGDDE